MTGLTSGGEVDREYPRRGRRVRRERECGEERHDEQAFHTCKNSIRPTPGGVESKPEVVHGLPEVFLMRSLLAALVLALVLRPPPRPGS